MRTFQRKDLLFLIFPKLRLVSFSFDLFKGFYHFYKHRKAREKIMRFGVKLAIGCGIGFLFIVIFGFVAFPKMIKGKIKKMVTLDPSSDIRQMFVKVPFPLNFKVYIFNVTNPMEIQEGKLPKLQEVGPFCYEEWKEKSVEMADDEVEDVMYYKPKDTFIQAHWDDCLSGEEQVTIPHPLILGMVNTLLRMKPGMLTLATKAINSIYKSPTSIFLTEKARNILFDGVIIECGVKDFAGKAVCTQLRTEAPDLRHVNDEDLAFSFMHPKNGTLGKLFKVYRGVKVSHDVGSIVEFNEKKVMDVWPTKECNHIHGTDGTIFPPFLTKPEGIVSFAPDLCRSLVAVYNGDTKYDGIPVRIYTATLGDMSKNADEKCYCLTPDTCLKKGVMDLYKCAGVPVYASLPHFYESDDIYVKGVEGLHPNKEEHGIQILFEAMTGSPLSASKRLQFSMPLEPVEKVPLFNKLPNTLLPIFWVEESVHLNNTFTKPLKDLFKIMKIVKIARWLIMFGFLGGLGYAVYLIMVKSRDISTTPTHKVQPGPGANDDETPDGFGGHVNHAMSNNDVDKY